MSLIIVRDTELVPIDSPGGNASAGIATPSRGAREVSVIRQRQHPGGTNPPHRHDREEVILVLRGELRISAGETTQVVRAGDAAIVPAETLHRLAAVGASDAEWLTVAPAGIRFVHENGEEASPPWAR